MGSTYTHSAGRSPDKPVLSHKPIHHPEPAIESPVSLAWRMIRSFFLKDKKLVFSPKEVYGENNFQAQLLRFDMHAGNITCRKRERR